MDTLKTCPVCRKRVPRIPTSTDRGLPIVHVSGVFDDEPCRAGVGAWANTLHWQTDNLHAMLSEVHTWTP